MRQVQYLTQLLQEIIFKKSKNKKQEAIQEINNALERLTKEHPKQFHELELEETANLFIQNDAYQAELALAVADLLVEEAEMLKDQQFSKSKKAYQQAYMLYKKAQLDKNAAVPLDIHQKTTQIKQELSHKNALAEIEKLLN
ncbi:hypothetical protein G3569_01365 [Aliifodinibius halophilus]|uniref:Tetratricopeptide repeat protein n=2 Tax=Fodinibius halophilus TaxID=1736908 RepID=A0A6M1STW1_9BACT|nr:hypothetical protein [Fodinibius halophilus]